MEDAVTSDPAPPKEEPKKEDKPKEEPKKEDKPKEEKKEEPSKEGEKKDDKPKEEPKKDEKPKEEPKKDDKPKDDSKKDEPKKDDDKKDQPPTDKKVKVKDDEKDKYGGEQGIFGYDDNSDYNNGDPYYDQEFNSFEECDMDYTAEEQQAFRSPLRISDMQNMEQNVSEIANEVSTGLNGIDLQRRQPWLNKRAYRRHFNY